MGPCGCGKSTVGRLVAGRLSALFMEGDDFHPEANRTKMAAGEPLTDADRWPWLDRIAGACTEAGNGGKEVVVACSALKRVYRERLTSGGTRTIFALLDGPGQVIRQRLQARADHFMPVSLLDSQLAALERPAPEENAVILDIRRRPEDLALEIAEHVRMADLEFKHQAGQ
ncbi:MAG: gluconokinase [Pseudomonadota bacterium]